MSPKLLMSVYAIFLVGLTLSCLISGVWLGSGEIDAVTALASFNTMEVQAGGVWNAPKTIGTYWDAIVTILSWNYPYLSSPWVFGVKFILWIVSVGVVFGLIQLFAGIIQGLVSIVRSFLPA